MVTSRERVKAALEFTCPDRAPRDLWTLPYVSVKRKDEYEAVLQEFPMDFGSATPYYPPDVYRAPGYSDIGQYVDEWGSIWFLAEPGVVGEVKRPALADWKDLERFQPPWDLIRKRDFSQANRQCDESDRFMLSECTVRIFERMQFLRGSENLFMDIAYGTREFYMLLEMLHEYFLEDLRGWLPTHVDAISMMDDWGSMDRLLIHPDAWREIYKPKYKEYCDLIHSAGKYAFFHSDGCIQSIYGDLIEVGMDAINSQLFTMDIEELGRLYKGKVTFWGELDRQHILPFGKPQEVREAVLRVRRALDDGAGGVIAQCEWGKPDPRENIEMVFETWL